MSAVARVAVGLLFVLLDARGIGAQTTDPAFPVAAARMFAVPTSRAWAEVLAILKEAGIKTEKLDAQGRFLVTQAVTIDAKRFGFTATDVLANATKGRVKLHVFVPAFIEPARVYVGSTVTAELQQGKGQMLLYSPDAFGIWLFRKLSPKLQVGGHQVPQDPVKRAALARSLIGNADATCLARVQEGVTAMSPSANRTLPKKLHEVQVVYPRDAYVNSVERTLLLKTAIGEDGFPWPVGVATGSPTDDFAITAMGSMSLWRFAPATVDGCPVTTRDASISVGFSIK